MPQFSPASVPVSLCAAVLRLYQCTRGGGAELQFISTPAPPPDSKSPMLIMFKPFPCAEGAAQARAMPQGGVILWMEVACALEGVDPFLCCAVLPDKSEQAAAEHLASIRKFNQTIRDSEEEFARKDRQIEMHEKHIENLEDQVLLPTDRGTNAVDIASACSGVE